MEIGATNLDDMNDRMEDDDEPITMPKDVAQIQVSLGLEVNVSLHHKLYTVLPQHISV